MADKKYKVIRSHYGDREYKVNDLRTANPAQIQHLIGVCLEEINKVTGIPADQLETAPINTSTDLTKINGVGPAVSERLKQAGFNSVEELASASVEQLEGITVQLPYPVQKYHAQAVDMVATAKKV